MSGINSTDNHQPYWNISIEMFNKATIEDLSPTQIGKVFLEACKRGNLEIVKYCFSETNSENFVNQCYVRAGFLQACISGNLDIVKCIHVNQNSAWNYNYSDEFNIACGEGHLEIAEYFMSINAEIPNLEDYKSLEWSVDNNHLPVVKMLLENAFDINDVDQKVVRKIFTFALENSLIDIAEYLFKLNSELFRKLLGSDINDFFQSACRKGNIKMGKFLYYTVGGIDIHCYNDLFFRETANGDYFEFSVWLYSLDKDFFRERNFEKDELAQMMIEKIRSYFL